MYGHHILHSRLDVNRYGCQFLSWSAEHGKLTFLCLRSRLRIWSRQTGWAVPSRVGSIILHTQAASGSSLSFRFPRRRPSIPSTVIGQVPSLSGHVITYRWRLPLRVHRHRASNLQGSSRNGCCLLRCTMDQFLFASLFPHPSSRALSLRNLVLG